MKWILIFIISGILPISASMADEFDFDEFSDGGFESFDEYAIETNVDGVGECSVANVALNAGDSPVAAAAFDIAGIMLGMSFDEVQMVVRENGLYTNRLKDSVVYSMHPDWKYSLDYECRQQNIFVPEKLNPVI